MSGARPAVGDERGTLAWWRSFYRDQARLIWQWRATRLALIRRALLTCVAAAAALLIVASLSPALRLSGPAALVMAALVLGGANALARPILLLVLSPLPVIGLQVAGMVVQVLIVLAIGATVPGVEVGGLGAAVFDGIVLSALNALFAEILRAADDDSYHGTQVRRLAAREFGRRGPDSPGLLMIQIDGLSLPVLRNQMRAGRMPALDSLVRSGHYALDPWFPLLPPVTPVSQAGILHGSTDDMPGFRWFEKASGSMIVANTPEGAAEIVRRRSDGRGLLADDGASIGNLVTGDAPRSYLTMATIADLTTAIADDPSSDDDPRRLRGIFVSQVNYIRLAVLTVGELLKELYQRERQRGRAIEPRVERSLHYAFERALTNVSLRNLTTALVIEEMFAGAPSIYVDYTGYDALAHHVGPERVEAVDALDGLDRTIGSLLRVSRETPRPYRFVFLSDHGQCLGATFSQRYGERLEDVTRRLMGATMPSTLRRYTDYDGTGRMILGEIGRGRGARSVIARRAARRRAAVASRPVEDGGDGGLVVCASGSLAQLYLTCSDDRLDREEIDRRYPGLIEGLVAHPGVGTVLVHSRVDGPVALGRNGRHDLDTRRVTGVDPLLPFGPLAAQSLRRMDGFANTGDLTILGPYDERTGEVVSYEELVGSHGGLGGWQAQPFLLHPADLPVVDAPLVGAVAVHEQLRHWLDVLRTGQVGTPTLELGRMAGARPGPDALAAPGQLTRTPSSGDVPLA